MVYVDDMHAPFGRMIMCHMVADTSEELHAMAKRIGVIRRWCQHQGTYREHYDICLTKRALAVEAGASEITWRQCGEIAKRVRAKVVEEPVVGFKACWKEGANGTHCRKPDGHEGDCAPF